MTIIEWKMGSSQSTDTIKLFLANKFDEIRYQIKLNKGKYYDEKTNTWQTLTKIILCHNFRTVWISTFDTIGDIYYFRPLVITDDNTISLLNINTNFKLKKKYVVTLGSTHDYNYCNFWVFNYDQFIDQTLIDYLMDINFTGLIGNKNYRSYQYRNDWITNYDLIEPTPAYEVVDDACINLYNKILMITGGISRRNDYHYNLNINVKMTLFDGAPTYYINKLEGDEGKDYRNEPINPFELIIRDNDMVLIRGNIVSLNNVLDKIFKEHGSSHTLHKYKKLQCFDLTEGIDTWFMQGCPNIHDIDYNILLNNTEILLEKITTLEIEIDFIRPSYAVDEEYLCVSNLLNGEQWILSREYQNVYINDKLEYIGDIYSDGLKKYKMTADLLDALDEYLEPIRSTLYEICIN